jgi:multisubunit Na+/H+ antiporter MnhF subunit
MMMMMMTITIIVIIKQYYNNCVCIDISIYKYGLLSVVNGYGRKRRGSYPDR